MRKIRDNNRLLKKMRRRHKVCHEHFEKNREEFMKLRRNFLFFKVLTILIVIFIIAYIFHVTGFEAIAFFLAGMIVAIEIINIFIYDKFNKKILRPVKALKDGMLKVADGDYTVRVENNARNEIGTLIDEFNNMIEKLEESRKLKKEYEKNRKDLIANISHDLKTPITSIKGYVDIICDGQIEDEQKIDRYLEIVKNNCDYMNNLIDDLFLFSKLDMQRVNFDFQKVNISDYLDDIMEEFSFTFSEDEQMFKYNNSLKKSEIVNLDSKSMYRTLRNIVGNAKKYCGVDLEVDVNVYGENDYVIISIKDNGPGIKEEHLKNIFERFYRVDKERTKDLMSTGLGLAIAKEIIEAHNGKIGVKSVIDKGSEFIIKLPISRE